MNPIQGSCLPIIPRKQIIKNILSQHVRNKIHQLQFSMNSWMYLLCVRIAKDLLYSLVNQISNSNVAAGRIELIIFVNSNVIDYIIIKCDAA